MKATTILTRFWQNNTENSPRDYPHLLKSPDFRLLVLKCAGSYSRVFTVFQCDNGSEIKAGVTKLLEKHEVKIQQVTTKHKHTHTAFVEAFKKSLQRDYLRYKMHN